MIQGTCAAELNWNRGARRWKMGKEKACVRSLTNVHSRIWNPPMPFAFPCCLGMCQWLWGIPQIKSWYKIERGLSSLLLPGGWRPLPFPPGSFWLEAGEECKFQSFVPTFIVIFLSGLLKWGLLMAAFKILCEVELGNISQVLWRGKCFISSFSAKQPFTDVPLLSSSGVLVSVGW